MQPGKQDLVTGRLPLWGKFLMHEAHKLVVLLKLLQDLYLTLLLGLLKSGQDHIKHQ